MRMMRASWFISARIMTVSSVCTMRFRLLYITGSIGGPEVEPKPSRQRSPKGRISGSS